MGSEKRGKTETGRESFETLIKEKAKEWEALGDPLATKIMTQGLKLFFSQKPTLRVSPPDSYRIAETTLVAMETNFLPKWEEKQIVREILDPCPMHFSILFMRPKKNGKLRPIIDLSELNKLLVLEKFKMETVEVIAKTIQGIMWACSVDIEDAYFHVPIHWDFHKFLGFKIRNRDVPVPKKVPVPIPIPIPKKKLFRYPIQIPILRCRYFYLYRYFRFFIANTAQRIPKYPEISAIPGNRYSDTNCRYFAEFFGERYRVPDTKKCR